MTILTIDQEVMKGIMTKDHKVNPLMLDQKKKDIKVMPVLATGVAGNSATTTF
jgi:hypothetical protein